MLACRALPALADTRVVMQSFLEEQKKDGLIQGGRVASESAQIADIWRLRESISVALNKAGWASTLSTLSHDMGNLTRHACVLLSVSPLK